MHRLRAAAASMFVLAHSIARLVSTIVLVSIETKSLTWVQCADILFVISKFIVGAVLQQVLQGRMGVVCVPRTLSFRS